MVCCGFAPHARCWRSALVACLVIGGLAAGGPWVAPASAQSIPSRAYDAGESLIYQGEYAEALKQLRDAGRGAIKTPQSRWIDSICYETMIGECCYRMGGLTEALDHYAAALQLYVAFSDWMVHVQFPATIRASASRTQIPWAAGPRQPLLGAYQREYQIRMGRIDQREVIERGGVVEPATLRLIRADEIVRCTALAIRRRAELLGPLAAEDTLLGEVTTRLSRRPGPPNHWSEAWIDLQLGLAYAAGGRTAQAASHLKQAILAQGEYYHPLTSAAVLELGRIAMAAGDYAGALQYFEEATCAAVYYPDMGTLEEAFRGAALAHLLANRKGVYPPLAAASVWARVQNIPELQTSLALSAAENSAYLGEVNQAAALVEEARRTIARRDMGNGRIGARLAFLGALTLFQQKKAAEGYAALTTAMGYMRRGSHWLLQISLVDGLYNSGGLADRRHLAMDLYAKVLRDPEPADWTFDPMEAMAVLAVPHPAPIDHWFQVAMAGKEYETALEISDRARRHRFFSSLPFGGRLESLRWILEGPEEALDQQSRLLRADLLSRYPAYEQLSREARTVRARLEAMPLVVDDPDLSRAQDRDLTQLAALSTQQEVILREMTVRREPAGLVFPPLRKTPQIQESLPPRHALLAFYVCQGQLYGFLLSNEDYDYWRVRSPEALSRQIVGLLREMGNYQPNNELTDKDLSDKQWEKTAQQVLQLLLEGSRADFSADFDELVIVPDGILWYLPFEALQVEIDGQLRPLISRFRIRCVPTLSLATSKGPAGIPAGKTAVVTGRLFPRNDDSVARNAFDQLARVLPGAVALGSKPPAPSSVYAKLFDRLIVLDDLNQSTGGPYDLVPVPADRGKAGGALSDWLGLPWGGPSEIILPGYHTAAEISLKGVSQLTAGDEVFLSVCGLMASGARTVLLSRWRTGGQTSFDLVREFAQELPHTSPADAWQRSVFLAAGSRVSAEDEPRVRTTASGEPLAANHPFFWAGYMLVDPGAPPPKTEPVPVLKLIEGDHPEAEAP